MTWEELKEFLKDKIFLIGLTFLDNQGTIIERYQTHGKVIELTNDGLFRIEKPNKVVFQIPYERESIVKAEKGEYRERGTGKIITNPDFVMTWSITVNKDDNFEDVKTFGFSPKG